MEGGLALPYPALERPLVPPDHGYDGETVSPSPQSNSQTSAGSGAFFEPASELGRKLCLPPAVEEQRIEIERNIALRPAPTPILPA
jgi:hypothetical protein